MKKIVVLVLILLLAACSAFAEVTTEQLDSLTPAEKTMLKINLDVAIIRKENNSVGPMNSYSLGIDLMELSIEELQWMRNYISGEADADTPGTDDLIGAVLCDYKLFTITVTEAEIRTHKLSDDIDLVLYVDIVNNNTFAYEGYIDTVSVNDWQVDKLAWFKVNGGKKQKEKLVIKLNDIEVFSLVDIETLQISFKLLYANYAVTTDEVTLKLK